MATMVAALCVTSIRRGRRRGAATTPPISENTTIGTTRTRPTAPRASPFRSGATSSETCQRIAAACMLDPVKETNRPIQSSRKLRWRRAGAAVHRGEVTNAIVSRQGRLHERRALLHFGDGTALPAVFVFDEGANRPPLAFEEREHFRDLGIARAPWRVVALITLAVLDVQVGDVAVVLAEVGNRVVVGGGEVADVEIGLEVLRQGERSGEAFGPGEFVRVAGVRVVMDGDVHPVPLGEWDDAPGDRQVGGCSDDLGAECLGHREAAID